MSSNPAQGLSQDRSEGRLSELARLFLRLGVTAFGGPAAHISMIRDEVVARRRWLTDQHFLPSFVFVVISNPFIPRLRRSPWAGSLLDGVNVASLVLGGALAGLLSAVLRS